MADEPWSRILILPNFRRELAWFEDDLEALAIAFNMLDGREPVHWVQRWTAKRRRL
jgi:hypothetical protein